MQMKLKEIEVGQKITCPSRGEGVVVKITPRTIEVKFPKSTVSVRYFTANPEFKISDL